MDEADKLCNRIAIMDHGKILVNDTSAAYYPWGALTNIRWFHVLTLFNPLTYLRRRAALFQGAPAPGPRIAHPQSLCDPHRARHIGSRHVHRRHPDVP
jgi:hypothetical protein